MFVLILASSMVLGSVSMSGCSLLCCDVVGVWGVVICVICDACSWRCSFMGRGCVSSCICCVFVSVVHPVAILSAVFCVICSLLMFVSDAIGDLWWERTRVWVLLWLCMLRGSFPFVSTMLLM